VPSRIKVTTLESQLIHLIQELSGRTLSTFYKLKKLGLGPDVLHVPGTRIERITPEARQAWRERMAELAKSETAQLQAERRRAQAAEAGKLAAQSPNHVSRRTAAPERDRANRRDKVARRGSMTVKPLSKLFSS
jgi:hypothetical protein